VLKYKLKTGCIIQGNIRTKHINLIVKEKVKYFDLVVISTWKDEKIKINDKKCIVIYNEKPETPGLSNRNLQRLSVANALRYLKERGVEYVLKWRTDMLSTNFNLNELLELANYNLNSKIKSRIVMPSFRTLSVFPDYLSSFPDHFSFGHIDEMEILWGDNDFNYKNDYNFIGEENPKLIDKYNAHSELYYLYKTRIQKKTNENLTHSEIVISRLNLIDLKSLKICWFKNNKEFRSIEQSFEYPWWTERGFKKNKFKLYPIESKRNLILRIYYLFKNFILIKINISKQRYWFKNFKY